MQAKGAEAMLLELFEKFAMHGKNIGTKTKADKRHAEEKARQFGAKENAAAHFGARARDDGAGGSGEVGRGGRGEMVAGAAVQGSRAYTLDQPEFVAFLDYQVT